MTHIKRALLSVFYLVLAFYFSDFFLDITFLILNLEIIEIQSLNPGSIFRVKVIFAISFLLLPWIYYLIIQNGSIHSRTRKIMIILLLLLSGFATYVARLLWINLYVELQVYDLEIQNSKAVFAMDHLLISEFYVLGLLLGSLMVYAFLKDNNSNVLL
jgi:glucan phosphoethanolaminetransferase (alkaline phosphatase superfamily)